MSFSTGVVLSDLSDYISPSQACVKPVGAASAEEEKKKLKLASVTLGDDPMDGVSSSSVSVSQLADAKVTLADCLACSGCITSAESVLIAAQSADEFFKRIKEDQSFTVISISNQAIASIATRFNVNMGSTYKKLITFFKHLGAKVVLDTNFAY
eukprot:TRINITY_DN2254_c0_g1_i4.p2 TRINITY_DN2254_c0_g1~~TRINITY_DN2254_c0_g1_i4.p2  ORF type:complete len:154 (+),score=42.44 TRINITY_DN2254_c0_g1_i4:35-496(+)